MKENRLITRKIKIICLLIFLLLLTIIGLGCGQKGEANTPEALTKSSDELSASQKRQLVLSSERSHVLVYFATPDQRYLVPATTSINPTQEVAKVAVEKLLAGPNNSFLLRTIPEETKLIDIFLAENSKTVYVDLTEQILEVEDGKQARLAVESLVFTLTELPEVKEVQIFVEGRKIDDLEGIDLNKPLSRPKGVNYLAGKKEGEQTVTLFFGDMNAVLLVPLTMDIPKTTGLEEQAEAALKVLAGGPPEDSELIRTVWPGTKILGVEYNQIDKILTVNFNQEVIGYGGGTAAEMLLTNSVLYTVTTLPGIEKVQFLIEGERVDYLPEGTDIYNPLPKPKKINNN